MLQIRDILWYFTHKEFIFNVLQIQGDPAQTILHLKKKIVLK